MSTDLMLFYSCWLTCYDKICLILDVLAGCVN